MLKFKTIEEIRSSTGMSQIAFAKEIGIPIRTYVGRLNGSQPRWRLEELINASSYNHGRISAKVEGKLYDIQFKEHVSGK